MKMSAKYKPNLNKCYICLKHFSSILDLQLHHCSCKRLQDYPKCTLCLNFFSSDEMLDSHIVLDHHKVKYECGSCVKKFYFKKVLRDHVITHTMRPRPFRCKVCNESFSVEAILDLHRISHRNCTQFHDCEICNAIFSSLPSLELHMFSHTKFKKHKCKTCHKMFYYIQSLKKHRLVHPLCFVKKKCRICPNTFAFSAHYRKHLLCHKREKQHCCKICKKYFSIKSLFDRHMVIHRTKKTYKKKKQPQWKKGKIYFSVKNSISHHTKQHPNKRNHKQTQYHAKTVKDHFPSKNFSNDRKIKSLIRNVHRCELCANTFPTKTMFENHMSRYKDLKEAFCRICNRRFHTKLGLSIHNIKVHPRKANQCCYECGHCGQEFSDSSALKVHMSRYKGLEEAFCRICNRRFRTKLGLSLHNTKVHQRKASQCCYECGHCGQEFSDSSALKVHVQINHGKDNLAVLKQYNPVAFTTNEENLSTNRIINGSAMTVPKHLVDHNYSIVEYPTEVILTNQSYRDETKETLPLPGVEFQKENLTNQGENNQAQENLLCEVCGEQFTTLDNFICHVVSHQDWGNVNSIKIYKKDLTQAALNCENYDKEDGLITSFSLASEDEEDSRAGLFYKKAEHALETSKTLSCERANKGASQFSTTCHICKRTLSSEQSLRRHMVLHTGIKKTIQCEFCPSTFRFGHHLKAHMLVHTGQKSFHCSTCGASFGRHSDLKIHMMIHTQDWRVSCQICKKGFDRPSSLGKHILKEHQ